MKKGSARWALFAMLAAAMFAGLASCKNNAKSDDGALALTKENLAGKWVLEGDSTKWYKFKSDGTYTSDVVDASQTGTFKIENGQVKLWRDVHSVHGLFETLNVVAYKNHLTVNSKRFNKTL